MMFPVDQHFGPVLVLNMASRCVTGRNFLSVYSFATAQISQAKVLLRDRNMNWKPVAKEVFGLFISRADRAWLHA